MAASVQVSHLVGDVGSAVHDAGSHLGAIGELPGLVVDLRGELPGGGQDQGKRILLAASVPEVLGTATGRTILVDPVENRDQERRGLAGPGLGARHEVSLGEDHRNRVFLAKYYKHE